MKRITAFTAALFLVLSIGATNGLAQDDTMKQTNTTTMQSQTMSGRSNQMTRRKMMMKKSTMK